MSEPSKSDGPKKPDPEKEEIDVSARHGKGAKDPFDLSPESINDSKWFHDEWRAYRWGAIKDTFQCGPFS